MKRFGFTLAEVLITIGIIGLIAEFTIPTLMNNIQNSEFKAAYKKTYSIINQATLELKTDNGGSLVGLFSSANNQIDIYKSKMHILTSCHSTDTGRGCSLNPLTNTDATITLSDGSIIGSNGDGLDGGSCNNDSWGKANFGQNICGEFYIDVNGNKKPNIKGKDMFWVGVGPDKVIPAGIDGMINTKYQCPDGIWCNSYKYLVE